MGVASPLTWRRMSFADRSAVFMENWPTGLLRFAIPHQGLRLQALERDTLADGPLGTERALESLAGKLSRLFEQLPGGGFIRLGSRSPKDVFAVSGTARVRTGRQGTTLLARSRRIRADCAVARANGYLPWLFVRQWRDIPAWSEFRGFMRGGELVGMCPYHCIARGDRPGLLTKDTIEKIHRGFFRAIRGVLPADDVIFDTYLSPASDSPEGWRATLVEINPFDPSADAVLFSWSKRGDFDGTFRDVEP